MIVEQLNSGKIVETESGAPKTPKYMYWEAMMSKRRAMKSFAFAWMNLSNLKSVGIDKATAEAYLTKYLDTEAQREDYSDLFLDDNSDQPSFE